MKAVPIYVRCAVGIVLIASASPQRFTDASESEPSPRFQITELAIPPGYTETAARGINASGQVVGTVSTGSLVKRACRWTGDKIEILGTLGGDISEGIGINDAGDVVGFAYSKSRHVAFLYHQRTMTNLGALDNSGDSGAVAINNRGQVCGSSQSQKGEQAFLWENGKMFGLGSLREGRSKGFAINESGQVVGEATHTLYDAGSRSCLWEDRKIRDISPLRSELSNATAINDAGQVAGFFLTKDGLQYHTYLFEGGIVRNLGVLSGTRDTRPRAINNQGRIVGIAYEEGGVKSRACLYISGKWHDLNELIPPDSGWRLSFAFGINDRGQIVGDGRRGSVHRGFVLTPR